MIFDSIILKLKGIMYLVYCAVFQNSFVYFFCSKLQTLQSEVDKSQIINPQHLGY